MSDQLSKGRRFRILNIVDDYTPECVGQIVNLSIGELLVFSLEGILVVGWFGDLRHG
jgi:putative transposase